MDSNLIFSNLLATDGLDKLVPEPPATFITMHATVITSVTPRLTAGTNLLTRTQRDNGS